MSAEQIYRINHNWTPDTNYHPEWIEMTKSQYMQEYGIEEGYWKEMVNAGVIITQRQLREKIIDLVGNYAPNIGNYVPKHIFNDIRKEYLDLIKVAEHEREEAKEKLVRAIDLLEGFEANVEVPEVNCSCHICAPCGCDYAHYMGELIAHARDLILECKQSMEGGAA